MERFESEQENKIGELVDAFYKAKRKAPFRKEFEKIRLEQTLLVQQLSNELISIEDFNEKWSALPALEGELVLETEEYLEVVLALLCVPKDQIQKIILHEKAHFVKAKEHGHAAQYKIQLMKEEDGSTSYYPFVKVTIKINSQEKQDALKILKEVIQSPDDLSDTDIEMLK